MKSLDDIKVNVPNKVNSSPLAANSSTLKNQTTSQYTVHRARITRKLARRHRNERSHKELTSRVITYAALACIVIMSIILGGVGTTYAYYQSQAPLLGSIAQHSLFQTTRIYDRNGQLLYELYDQQQGMGRRTYINYSDISPLLIDATVAAEDHTFWTNSGVDFTGIARAAVSNAQSNGVVEGGSTITQQLIKNQLFLGQQRTLQVKGAEAILATGLTQQYPKSKIIEMYLNTVYYGDLNYGVEAAAENYFNLQPQCKGNHCKPAVSQLTLGEAAMLAGLPQSPTAYNPLINKKSALDRQTQILQSMVEMHYITKQQMQSAKKEMANFQFVPYEQTHKIQAPHFVWYVIQNVLEPLLGAQNLATGGYNIYTTLDLNLEKQIEQITHDDLYKPQQDNYLGYYGPLNVTNNVNNAAAIVTNPYNGEILAMNGSADYNQNTPTMQGQYNAVLAPRQPGSSFKPIVYATAFEMGWYPAMIVPDHKTVYPGNAAPPYYSPQNYDGTYHTSYPMTIRTAIANSFNIPAVDAIEYVGLQNVANMAGRLGISEVANASSLQGPAVALGAKEVSLLHMTSAYATFANRGIHVPPTSVLEITDNQGHPIYKFDEAHPKGVQAVREDVAFMMSSILSDKQARYHEFGPGNPLELDRPAAAKTGTTNLFRDNWTIGYTPHLAVGVWAGNSDNSIMNNVIGITGAGPIWHDIMEYTSRYYNFPADDFVKPDDVHLGTVSAITGLLPRLGEPIVSDWFIDGTMPTIYGRNYYIPNGPVCRRHCHPNKQQLIPPIGGPIVPPIGGDLPPVGPLLP